MCINNLNDLLEKPFKTFTREEQLQIVRKGRFTDLVNLSQNDRGKYRTFSASWYHKFKWLTGNTANRKLYCWNCVLYAPSGPGRLWNWNSTGFDDLKNLSQATRKHEESKEHIYATVKLKLLCKNKKPTDAAQVELERNVLIKRNREYLERLIDISCALARLEIPFRNEDGSDGPYKCFLSVLKNYDDIVRTQVEQTSPFTGLTETIQIDLVQSIAHVILQRITEEVSAANFFALMMDEINCNPCSRQISMAIRYVKNGRPIERFIGLYDVNYGKKSEDLMVIVDKELNRFNYKEKMVAQCYDGAVVRPTELFSLQQCVKRHQGVNRRAQSVHCYAHEFNSLLAQSLRSLQECKLFFSVISLFCSFFKKIQIKDILINVSPTWIDSVPTCVLTVKNNYVTILKILEFVTKTEKFENSIDVIAHAVNLVNHLKNPKFMIFLIIFENIFKLVNKTFDTIQEKPLDTTHYRMAVNDLIEKLKQLKTEGAFGKLVHNVSMFNRAQSTLMSMKALYIQILDNIIYDIDGRFLDIEISDFFALVSLDYIPKTPGSKKTPDSSLLGSIKENYSQLFDTVKLKTELDLFYGDPTIGGVGECDIKRTSDILKFIHDNEIKVYVPELYKLLELVVTVPSLAEPLEGSSCALNRIKEYCSSKKKEEPRSALALLAIERELLGDMEKSTQWHSQIIECFASLPSTSSIELTYKDARDAEASEELKFEVIAEPELMIKTEAEIF